MPKWILTLALVLPSACASAPSAPELAPGPDAPLVAPLLRGGQLDLDEDLAAGRPVALVFWQSWCSSCIAEAPAVEAAALAYAGRIHIVGVVSGPDSAVDEDKLWARILELGLSYEQLRDRDLALTRRFGVTGTPTVVILDPDGQVVFNQHHVPASWDAFL